MEDKNVGKGSHTIKSGLVMDFFCKGGGLDPIHDFVAHFCTSRVKDFFWCKIEGYRHFILSMAILGVLGNPPPFFVTKNQMCLMGFITSKNRGGGHPFYGRIY